MNPHIHAPFLDLVPHSNATHIAVNDGNWFDPNTWQNGNVPNDNADVLIPEGVEVFYNQESDARIHTIRIDGSLTFSQNTNTQLIVDYVAVSDTGTLEMGTELNPIQAQANIIFAPVDPDNPEIDTDWDPHQVSRGLVAGHGAKVSIFGEEKTSYITLADNHLAGATELTFSEPVPGDWEVGDTIVLTGTAWDATGSHEDNSITQDEVLTIESINGNTITFSHNDVNGNALRFDHTTPEGFDLDIYVANLTRNVVFQSEGGNDVPPSQRGHTMFMDHDTKIYNAGFYSLGRTDKDIVLDDPQFDGDGNLIPGTGTNPRARYPIHFHEILEHHHPDMDMNMDMGMDMDTAEVNGSVIWDSPGWGLSVHSSRADIIDNVSFDVVGAHFVTEDGDEQATFRGNIAIKAAGAVTDAPADLLQPTGPRGDQKDFGVRGMGFWLGTTYSVVNGFEDNIVTGTKDSGIFVYGHNDIHAQPIVPVSTLPEEIQWIAGEDTEIQSWAVPLINFRGNKVYNAEGGIEFRGVARDDRADDIFGMNHDEQNVVEDFTIWGVRRHGVDIQYASHITVKDSLIVGNPDDPITRNHIYSGHLTTQGVGINSDKNARSIVIENNHVEGFEIGATIPQTARQGYNTEAPAYQSRLIGGTFQNNLYNLYPASGRVDNFPSDDPTNPFNNNSSITPYFEIEGNPTFEIPVNDQAPVADFTTTPSGGLAVNFDASQSFDPDYIPEWTDSVNNQYTSGDNTIASFAWDFDNDGVIDDFGRYATYIYDQAGIYSVNLTVTDIQGNTAEVTQEVNVTANPFPNIVAGGDFGTGSSDFKATWVNVSFFNSFSEENWFYHHNNNRWTKDTDNGWVSADSSGASGLINVINDRSVTRGLQNIRFDATNIGSNNTLKLEVYGINGVFDLSVWGGEPSSASNTVPFEAVKLLDTGNIADNQFDWTNFEWANVDFGSGYQTIALRFTTAGVEDTNGEFQAIDNVFIGNLSTSVGNPNSSPVAVNDVAQVNENESVIIDVLANDSDPDGDFLFISNITQSSNGIVSDNGDGTLTYIPNNNFSGNDSFSYTVSDLQGGLDTATVSVNVNQSVSSGTLSFNDYSVESYGDQDKNSDAFIEDNSSILKITGNAWKRISMPYEVTANTVLEFDFFSSQQGEIQGIAFDNDNEHRTNSNYLFKLFGTQDFGDQTFDDYHDSVGQWKNYRIEVGQFYTGQMNELVFVNDHDVFNPTAESLFSNVRVYENTSLPTNNNPIAVDDNLTTDANTPITISATDLLLNDSDLDGDQISLTNVNNAVNGTVQLDDNGDVIFTPDTNFSGTATFNYTINDGQGSLDTATVSVNVNQSVSSGTLSFDDYSVESYGDQDKNSDAVIEDDGSSLKITGNGWKRISMPYEVTANTVLEFDFFSSQQGEIQGIAFDNDNEHRTNSNYLFKLFGTQDFGDQTFDDYHDSVGQWKNYRIEVGQFYTGQMNELVFVNDHDVSNPTAESLFSNVRVYEETPDVNNSIPLDPQIPDTPPNSDETITQVNTITGTDGQDILDGTSGDDLIEGNGGKDTLSGSGGNDDLRGGSGNDDLRGGSGNDDLRGGSGNDDLRGGNGNDTLRGGSGNDTLRGGSGNDNFRGGSGNDTLRGDAGDDILTGGAGNDNLMGGAGNDIFNFSANQGRDRIRDFESGDKIRLQEIDPQSLELIERNGNTFLDLGNNQGITLLDILPDALNVNILPGVIELTL